MSASPNSTVHFATTFRQDDGTLVAAADAKVVFRDAVAGVSEVALAEEGAEVGFYTKDWTVPAGAAVGFYDWWYQGDFAPFEGADVATWKSDLRTLEVVAATPSTPQGSTASLAANALTTLGAAKSELGIPLEDDADLDPRISRIINAASGWIESRLNRNLGRDTVTELLSGRGRQRLNLERYPILELVSVQVDGADVSDECKILNGARGARGQIWRKNGFPLSAFGYRDLTADVDPSTADLNVEAEYRGGYVLPRDEDDANPRTLPWEIEWACIRIVKIWYDRDPDMKRETSEAGYSYEVDPNMARGILQDLRVHKRWV